MQVGNQWATAIARDAGANYSISSIPFLSIVAFPIILSFFCLRSPLYKFPLASSTSPHSPPSLSFSLSCSYSLGQIVFDWNPYFVQFSREIVNASYLLATCHSSYLKVTVPLTIHIHNLAIILFSWELNSIFGLWCRNRNNMMIVFRFCLSIIESLARLIFLKIIVNNYANHFLCFFPSQHFDLKHFSEVTNIF